MSGRPFGRGVCLAIMLVASVGVRAQLLEHPYHYGAWDERTLSRFVDEGMVRRAYDILRAMRAQSDPGAALDAVPFVRSSIERRSDNEAAADRVMHGVLRERPSSPSVPFAWLERGLAAIEDGDDAAAITYLSQAASTALTDLDRRNDPVYHDVAHMSLFWKGAALARTGHHAEALSTFRAATMADSLGAYADRSWYAIGQLYERNRQYDSALVAFGVVRDRYPAGATSIAARVRAAQNNLILRRPERALDVLTGIDALIVRAAAGDTSLLEQEYAEHAAERVMFIRAEASTMRGAFASALERCRAFLQTYPASEYRWYVRLHEAYTLLRLDSNAAAAATYGVILDSITADDDPLRQLAMLYQPIAQKRAGDRAAAIAALQGLAVQTGYPYQSIAAVEVGQAAYEDGDWDKARKFLETAERTSDDAVTTVRAQLLLGAALIEQQQWSKAAQAFARAEQRALKGSDAFMPGKQLYLAEARLKRGICLVQANQTRDAITALTDYLGNHPTEPRRDEATFWLAEAMYRADLLKNAQELYDEIVKRYTGSMRREEAMYGLAWTYFRRRDFDRSTHMFGELVRSFPQSKYAVEAMARRGDGFYISRQYRAAADAYEDAARRAPGSDEGQYASFQVGQSRYRANDLDGAARAMRAFVQQYPSSRLSDDALYLIGWVAFQQERYDAAIVEFRRIIEAYPSSDQSVRALYTIADAQYNMGAMDDAMATYRQVIGRYPSHPLAAEAARAMQIALLGMGRTDEALAVADTFINANPTSSAAELFQFKKAEIFYSGKNYPSAASELEAYLKKYPGSDNQDEAIYLLGKTYLSMQETGLARQTFDNLDKRFPESKFRPMAMLDLAEYFDKAANVRAADSIYARVIEAFPDDVSAASRAGFERATIMRMRGDTAAAVLLYLRSADRYTATEYGDQSRYQVAMYYRGKRQVDSMRYHLGILATRVDVPLLAANALYLIGESFVRDNQQVEAIKIFERVREDFAGNEDWYTLSMLGLGEAYEAVGRTDDAKDVYRTISTLRPDDDYGKAALARLKRMERRR